MARSDAVVTPRRGVYLRENVDHHVAGKYDDLVADRLAGRTRIVNAARRLPACARIGGHRKVGGTGDLVGQTVPHRIHVARIVGIGRDRALVVGELRAVLDEGDGQRPGRAAVE